MQLVSIKSLFRNLSEYEGKEVTIGGWLRSKRDSKTFGFLVVNDGTFFEPLQVVYSDALVNFADISKLNVGSALVVTGVVTPTPQAKQPFEIQADRDRGRGGLHSGLPAAEEAPYAGVSPHDDASASKNEYVPGGFPCAFYDRLCHSQVFPRAETLYMYTLL